MKRKLIILAMFILLMLAAIPSAMAACSHTCTWRITKSSTCTVAGSKNYQCTKCNTITKTATIPAKGHNPTTATCTTASKCTRCNATISPAKGHSWGSWTTTVNPTCVTAGKKVRKCSACPQQETQGINVTAHTYRWVTTNNATCTKAGEKKYACSYCEAVSKTESIPKIAHPMGSWTTKVSPTCTTAGRKERKCTKCSYTESEGIGKSAHTYKWVTTNNPTCTKTGEKRYMCSYCDYWEQSEVIPKVAHSMGSWTTNYDSTCVNPGQKERKCANCSYKETQGIALKAHTYKWVTTNSPTCTKTGEKRYMCSYCDYWEQSEVIPKEPDNHNWNSWYTKNEPTCVTAGLRERKCSDCPATETQGIPVTAHPCQWVITNPATCIAAGEERYMCPVCDYWDQSIPSRPIAKLGHTWAEATCTLPKHCTRPGCGLTEGDPTGHSPVGDAYGKFICDWCGEKYCRHYFCPQTKKATCLEDGKEYIGCSYCGAEDESEPAITIKAPGTHDWHYEIVGSNPEKHVEIECGRCGETQTRPLTEAEFALFQDDIPAEELVEMYGEDTVLGFTGDWEGERKSKEFADIIKRDYSELEFSDANIKFMERMIKMGNGEFGMDILLPIVEIEKKNYSTPDEKRQALKDLGYDDDMVDGLLTQLDLSYMSDSDIFSNSQNSDDLTGKTSE